MRRIFLARTFNFDKPFFLILQPKGHVKLQDSTRYVHGQLTFDQIEKHLEDWEASNAEFFGAFEERITDQLREEFSSKLAQIQSKFKKCTSRSDGW